MTDTKDCVVGFYFDKTCSQVVLIEKNRPAWQAGRYNGVGGKIKQDERAIDAMRREFLEEAGVDVPDWRLYCRLNVADLAIFCFESAGDLTKVTSKTSEQLIIVPVGRLNSLPVIPNLRWLVPMALDEPQVVGEVNQ